MAEKLLLAIAITFSLNLLMGFSASTNHARRTPTLDAKSNQVITLAAGQTFLRRLNQ